MPPISVLRGQIYYADLDPSLGSEQGGVRPVLVIQNDIGNRHSPTLIEQHLQEKYMLSIICLLIC